MTEEADPRRIDRRLGWIMSIGGVALLIGTAPPMLAAADQYATVWNLGVLLLAGLVCVLAVMGRALPHAALRAGWIIGPVFGWVLQLTAFGAYSGPAPPETLPWILSFDAVLSAYLVLWMRPRSAFVATLGSALLVPVSALVFLGSMPSVVAVVTPIHMSNIIFIVLFVAIRGRMLRVRAAARRAQENHERRVRSRIQAAHHERLARLIHDEVLSVLTVALPSRGEPGPQLRGAADHALTLLRARQEVDEPGLEPCERALARLTATIIEHDPGCRLHTVAGPGSVPTVVGDAVVAASSEAIRNSLRHAGRDATRSLHARITPDSIMVSISDDGVGFDPHDVRPGALGIEQSIVGRMRALPGGDASVSSVPGASSMVVLTWHT